MLKEMIANLNPSTPATLGDIEALGQAFGAKIDGVKTELKADIKRVENRLDDHSERLGRVEDLLIEINRKL